MSMLRSSRPRTRTTSCAIIRACMSCWHRFEACRVSWRSKLAVYGVAIVEKRARSRRARSRRRRMLRTMQSVWITLRFCVLLRAAQLAHLETSGNSLLRSEGLIVLPNIPSKRSRKLVELRQFYRAKPENKGEFDDRRQLSPEILECQGKS